jgi:hypothetical protein
MEFSNSVNGNGLVQDIDFLSQTNSDTYPLADKVRNINNAYYNVNRLIWEVADGWQYDDTNKTDLPIATTTLTHNQKNYTIPSTAQRIQRIEVKDQHGDWSLLSQIDIHDLDSSINEYLETAGLPQHYDIIGDSVFLYPSPSSAYVAGSDDMQIYFDRCITEFTTASTTSSPGFAAPFHRILSLSAAIDNEKDSQKLQRMVSEKSDLVAGLKRFYSNRNVERRPSIRPVARKYWRQYE